MDSKAGDYPTVHRVDATVDKSFQLRSGMDWEDRRQITIPQSLWLLGLGVLLVVLLRVIAPALPWLLSPERIQDQGTLHEFVGTLAQVLSGVLGFTIVVTTLLI